MIQQVMKITERPSYRTLHQLSRFCRLRSENTVQFTLSLQQKSNYQILDFLLEFHMFFVCDSANEWPK